MKYSKSLVVKLCAELASGLHTIEDCCKKVGITKETFYQWKKAKPDFSDAIKEAEESRLTSFKDMAISGLAVLLSKHEYEEIHTEYVESITGKDGHQSPPKIKSQKRVKKFNMPNPAAVIFTLTNRDPENWKNIRNHDHKSNGKGFLDFLQESSVDESQ